MSGQPRSWSFFCALPLPHPHPHRPALVLVVVGVALVLVVWVWLCFGWQGGAAFGALHRRTLQPLCGRGGVWGPASVRARPYPAPRGGSGPPQARPAAMQRGRLPRGRPPQSGSPHFYFCVLLSLFFFFSFLFSPSFLWFVLVPPPHPTHPKMFCNM